MCLQRRLRSQLCLDYSLILVTTYLFCTYLYFSQTEHTRRPLQITHTRVYTWNTHACLWTPYISSSCGFAESLFLPSDQTSECVSAAAGDKEQRARPLHETRIVVHMNE